MAFKIKGENALCCISSDLLKISVRVRGTIISESPVSKTTVKKKKTELSLMVRLTKSKGLMFCLKTTKFAHEISQLSDGFRLEIRLSFPL